MSPAVFATYFRYLNSVQIFNQYSFLIFSLVGLIVAAVSLLRRGRARGRLVVLAAAAVALVVVWFVVRPTATPVADSAAVQAQMAAGLPVLVELQSPY